MPHDSGPLRSPDAPAANGGTATPAPPSVRLDAGSPKIQAFEQRLGSKGSHEDKWKRSPNVTGKGAIHVKSFHCKLNNESLEFMDQQINEWLDAHPQYEVKLVNTTVGDWTGKQGREPNLIVQVWV
ncbi:MAG TPA: hypothetical protein VD997_00575 [Phycisphaerales bacterium]|nr:hypothetical protein [Phycisphaerales bacterium]